MADTSLPSPAQVLTGDLLPIEGYSESERMRILAHYVDSNSIRATARATGVPYMTLWGWLQSEETQSLVDQIRQTIRAFTAIELAENARAALLVVRDGLTKGDIVGTDKNGHPIYARVKTKDAAIVASVMIDKSILLTGQLRDSSSIDSALDKLADQLLSKVDSKLNDSAKASAANSALAGDAYLG